MTDRTARLESALRAEDALIADAKRLLTAYVEAKRVHPDAVINDLLWLFDGPRQREAQRLVREALGGVDTYRIHKMIAARVTTAK